MIEVLHDVDFTIKPGETMAIAGRTGAGKSSIASLIARFYEVTGGRILVDGHNVSLGHPAVVAKADRFRAPGPLPVLRHHRRQYSRRTARGQP